MDTESLIKEIDAQIAKLQRARIELAAIDSAAPKKRRGRPPKTALPTPKASRKRTLSADARAKIAEAQRQRWAKQKKASK